LKFIHVAVGVVKRNDTFFICKRSQSQHQGGLWEFPGGKVEANETVEQALSRELKEEIDITVLSSYSLLSIKHEYSDKNVHLDVHIVDKFDGEPIGNENQLSCWVNHSQLDNLAFPEANKAIIEALKLAF